MQFVGRTVRAVAVCIPARDEERRLAASLSALGLALAHPGIEALTVRIAVVVDGGSDRSADVALRWGRRPAGADQRTLVLERPAGAGNVGAARRAGMSALLADLGDAGPGVWLASTDADTRVPPEWLDRQLRAGVDAWAGTVTIGGDGPPGMQERFAARYGDPRRRPVHGASLGVVAPAYVSAGGFPAWRSGEDRGLWRRLLDLGAIAVHDPGCPVVTSARLHGRAPRGFARWLAGIHAGAAAAELVPSPDHEGAVAGP